MSTNKNNINQIFFKFLFIFSIFVIFACFGYKFINYHINNKISQDSAKVQDVYRLISIYDNANVDSDYVLLNSYPIIGKIEIAKLNISYPILSYLTDDYLKISPCRFYGPSPNQFGNMCIAGHNYNNNDFFSNILYLENNDIIKIYDLNNKYILYKIYSKYEVEETDISVLNQKYNIREITLVTCNNRNHKRIIIKAKETNF